MHKKITLPNGVRVILIPLAEAKSVAVSFYVKAGSRFESEQTLGLSHFLEHLAFKGSEKYRTSSEIAKLVEGLGGSMNAGTSAELIEYDIRVESSQVLTVIEILYQMVFHPLLEESEISKEKGVIVEEINMYEDLPNYKAYHTLEELLWPGHPLGRMGAGTKQSVESFTRAHFLKFKDSFFNNQNLVVCVSGKFQEDAVLQRLEELLKSVPNGEKATFNPVDDSQELPRIKVIQRKSEQTHLALAFKTFKRSDPRKYQLILLAMILGGGFSSKLFQRIREELGLAYYISADTSNYLDTGFFGVSAGLSNEKALEGIKEIFKQIKSMKDGKFTEEDLQRSKNHLKGIFAMDLEDQEKLNPFIAKQELLEGAVKTFDDVIEEIELVKLDSLYELASHVFDRKKLSVALVGNIQESVVFDHLDI